MSEEQPNKIDIKEKVMGEIKKKKICMASQRSVLAKKLGMEGVIVADLLAGALVISLVFYIFKKTKMLKFFSLGIPGLKVILSTVPYGYIALFAAMMLLALYLANKLDLCYETKLPYNILTLTFLGLVAIVGIIFILFGAHQYFENITENKIPREKAISGRVENFTEDSVTIEEENGDLVKVKLGKDINSKEEFENNQGRYLRAVGVRDPHDGHYFQAESILCCDSD
jgi:hypothetical protein